MGIGIRAGEKPCFSPDEGEGACAVPRKLFGIGSGVAVNAHILSREKTA
jgi:hypothetical protein